MIRALSFDLDGTLVDTAGEIAAAVNLTLADIGIAPRSQAEITLLIGNGLRPLMLQLLARLFMNDADLARHHAHQLRPEELLANLDRHYAAVVGSKARPYATVCDALVELRSAGYRLACVTNKEGSHTRRVLQAAGLANSFDLVIAGDTLAQKKPHPLVLTTVAQRLGVATSELAHVGDSRTDLEAARNAGVAAWAVPYGYNAGVPIQSCDPERLYADFAEIVRDLQRDRRAAGLAGNLTRAALGGSGPASGGLPMAFLGMARSYA
jgi:phosphoglycolate phosphatase